VEAGAGAGVSGSFDAGGAAPSSALQEENSRDRSKSQYILCMSHRILIARSREATAGGSWWDFGGPDESDSTASLGRVHRSAFIF